MELECNLPLNNYEYMFDFIEWRKDQQVIDFSLKTNKNVYLTWNKNMLVINKAFNESNEIKENANAVFSCFINKNEMVSSFNVVFKQSVSSGDSKMVAQGVSQGSSLNQSKHFLIVYKIKFLFLK